ncbi:YgfZ/GcvT domain-containing protein [Ilumatobacter sp.]|uniref:CAF17-like 4Fe-4S cluster assembly/insertion protein YgfZ n=1 Tax=Ilumatobacter sp. TaxID=1967498 RepID=UPI003B52DA8A
MDTADAVAATENLIDQGARDRVTVAGADACSYLQSQISQEIRDLELGAARWTFVLDPSGKIDALARVQRTADDVFVLDTDAGFGATLLARLDRFKIRVDAETTLDEADAAPSLGHELARISAGWPRMGHEIEPGSTIPASTGIVHLAVDRAKGCYPGQELVERMDSRGADAPRSLRIVDLDSNPDRSQAVGDPVHDADGTEVGTITSVAGEGGVGLALVRRGAEVGRLPDHVAT